MSEELERLALKLERGVGRRGFLGTLSAASATLVAAIFGFAQKSEALVVACICCTLCVRPGACENCACTWSWTCCPPGKAQFSRTCGECYRPGVACNGGCRGVFCSFCSQNNVLCS